MSGTVTIDKAEYDGMVERIRVFENEESAKVKNLEKAIKAIEEDGAFRQPGLIFALDGWIPRQVFTKDEMVKKMGERIEKLMHRNLIQRIFNEEV
jgi:DNA-binding MarR family transcriptional regulator